LASHAKKRKRLLAVKIILPCSIEAQKRRGKYLKIVLLVSNEKLMTIPFGFSASSSLIRERGYLFLVLLVPQLRSLTAHDNVPTDP